MAQHITASRLKTLISEADARGANLAWLDPRLGLVFGDQVGKPTYAADIGREELVIVASDAGHAPTPAGGANASIKNMIHPDAPAGRRTGQYVLILEDTSYAATSQKQLLLIGLERIEQSRPGALEKLALEKGRTKRVISQDRSLLNADPKLAPEILAAHRGRLVGVHQQQLLGNDEIPSPCGFPCWRSRQDRETGVLKRRTATRGPPFASSRMDHAEITRPPPHACGRAQGAPS